MKFDCGETWEEKKARQTAREKYLKGWHDYFAIIPREVGPHDCRFLETIERKGIYCELVNARWWSWSYRAKEVK